MEAVFGGMIPGNRGLLDDWEDPITSGTPKPAKTMVKYVHRLKEMKDLISAGMKKSQDKEKTKRPAVPLGGWERSMLPHEWRVDSEGREQLPMGFKLQPNSFVVVIPKTPPAKGSLAPEMLGPYQVVSHDQVFKRVQLRNLVNDEVKTWSDDSVVPFDDSLYNDDQLKKLCAVGKDEYIIEKVISHHKGLNSQDEEEYIFEVKWLTWAETFLEPGSGLAHNLTFKQYVQDYPEVADFYSIAIDD
ncbi:hypothetical protein ADUPG1_003334 [Aduncisulcus paluster]|uniref:Chromo domain-containing protein n=1 Tax=Aduncisulcus paluster TaxID=2918883 RepID=A0ABQ5KZC2_9EUKA|nr:hypothetical protein ADUPG1_003334 [Aduncisulcus paluster]